MSSGIPNFPMFNVIVICFSVSLVSLLILCCDAESSTSNVKIKSEYDTDSELKLKYKVKEEEQDNNTTVDLGYKIINNIVRSTHVGIFDKRQASG